MKVFRSAGSGRPIVAIAIALPLAAGLLTQAPFHAAAEEAPSAADLPMAGGSGAATPSPDTAAAADASQQPASSSDSRESGVGHATPESAATTGAADAPQADGPAPEAAPPPAASGPPPETKEPASASVVINLIRLLVQEGVLTQAKADALIRQAQDEANAAAAAEAAGKGQGIAVPVGGQIGTAAGAAAGAGESGAAASTESAGAAATAPSAGVPVEGALPKAQPPSIHVQYVPEIVKKQITDQVRQEVMQQAKNEHWAEPNALPEWTKRIKLSGDFRLRQEWDLFDKRNNPFLTNFAAINASGPFDETAIGTGTISPPFLNTTEDRQRMRIRARLGLTADITDDFTAGIRLATGNFNNPVSTNLTLGNTLTDQNFLLDRAYVEYRPVPWLNLFGGRFANPWFFTDLVWDPDLNFDGVAVQYTPHPSGLASPFLTAGVFPIENTPFNFPDNSSTKVGSRDKWLYGAQAGIKVQPKPSYSLKAGIAYYDYVNVQGVVSSPCNQPLSASIPCDTDDSRPGFMQQGNTVFDIRNLNQISDLTKSQFQFVGLASAFRELNATFQFDYEKYAPLHLIFDADFVTNLAFNKQAIAAKNPQNNLGADGTFVGGGNGYQARLTFGYPELDERWDWNVYAAYKWLESDAVLDAFTDSDFHLGGTNAKGYIFGGGLGIAHNIDLSARWLSSSEITGPPYTVDVIQLDLNGRF